MLPTGLPNIIYIIYISLCDICVTYMYVVKEVAYVVKEVTYVVKEVMSLTGMGDKGISIRVRVTG